MGEVGEFHHHLFVLAINEGKEGLERLAGDRVFFQVPSPGGLLFPAEPHGSYGQSQVTGGVEHRQFPVAMLLVGIGCQVAGAEEPAAAEVISFLVENNQERQIGVTGPRS